MGYGNMKTKNLYMVMDIKRVRQDALHGVILAREAYSILEPEKARLIGIGVSIEQAKRKNE
jgi:hypothetical protein